MTARSRVVIAVAVAVLLASGVAAQSVQVAAPEGALRCGEPFVLQIDVAWPGGVAAPAPLAASSLAPLYVERIELAAETERQRRYRCTARSYQSGEVVLAAIAVQVPVADGMRTVTAAPQRLQFLSALPEPAGELEWPGDVRLPQATAWWGLAGIGVVVAAGGVWWARRRQQPPVLQEAPRTPAPDIVERLRALVVPADAAEMVAFFVAVKQLLREHLHATRGIAADVATSEELCRCFPNDAALRSSLQACDLVLFAAHRADAAFAVAAREAALRSVSGSQRAGLA